MPKGSASAPQAFNPSQVAQQQTTSNIQTAAGQAALNNTNQVTPFGSLNYTEGPWRDVGGGNWVPTYTATTTLSPAQQSLLDAQNSVTGKTYNLANQYADRIGAATSAPFNYDSLGPAPTYDKNSADKATQALISRNQPQMDRDQANLIQRLANQGVSVGSPAYNAAFDQEQRGTRPTTTRLRRTPTRTKSSGWHSSARSRSTKWALC